MSKEVVKEKSMVLQKEMLAGLFKELSQAHETGKKVVYTFVPGNLSELIHAFDMLPVYPEINALQSGMRKNSGAFIREAEKAGHSEDVCTYVKCDIGMMLNGNIGPTGEKLPPPDLLLLSYTGCFTFMKWFENLERYYPGVPVAMLHTPYQEGGKITQEMRDYMVEQLRLEVIPKMEKVSGKKFDERKLAGILENSARAEDLIVKIFDTTKNKPSPIDAYFAGVYYIGPINTGFRGTPEAVIYYETLYEEILERVRLGLGPITPEGEMEEERFRLVVEGPPNWTSFREFWKLFYDMGAVVVASSYTKVGGMYDYGFRHDPARPLESLGEYCMNCYTNLNLPQRIDLLEKCITEYQADGFLVNSIKSCNSFSAGQLLMMRHLEERLGIPVGFIESDLVDPRYFSYSNIKNRLDSFFQMLGQRKVIKGQLEIV
ncbi:MAG: benzoyl-CoA reductase subunit B [Saprospiraceae bacterium]|nr:benzoyl-CoA reductase subunit B [Saprospiraceae bacterium]MCF8249015.1 benzoyl-CoA reductase subunit B [Saprospiraceae bacterium]MCF8282427.1 benzoyl-CoA reductase subunit B [Bacteroidales bacterium]MCF8310909.1 benzoyl-CoA reductase subunit B [Saprospiraceae bacterium]MCF8439503.1 benzoyl-CoA reductase subunit B [Saprospiraceae bacterium]